MSEPTFVVAFVAAYFLSRLVATALSSTWFVRLCAAILAMLVVADLFRVVARLVCTR